MKKFESIYIPDLEDYIQDTFTNRPSPLFLEVEKHAIKTRVPILTPATGEVLQYIISQEKPNSILELGTGIGYSILWMLSTKLPLKIISWERNKTCIQDANQFIEAFIQKDQIVILENLNILDTVKNKPSFQEFDFVFVDCDKICYPELLSLLSLKMKPGSVLVFDNVLWHGRLQKDVHTRPSDHSIQTFWDKVLTDFCNRTLFPVGDGLLLLHI